MTDGKRALAAIGLAGLVACGGGGGGSGAGSLDIAIDGGVELTTSRYASIPLVPVDATLSYIPTGNIYLQLIQPEEVFTSDIQVAQTGPNRVRLYLQAVSDLAVGEHTGVVTLSVCRDAACGTVLGQASFAYAVHVKPMMEVTAVATGDDGVVVGPTTVNAVSPPIHLAVYDQMTLEFSSNGPVAWTWTTAPGTVTIAEDPASTDTVWRGRVSAPVDGQPQQLLMLHGAATDGTGQSVDIGVMIYAP
ncbi:MAG: hypothetical protein QM767_05790 [Anaeromyxobacter sp.]